MDLPLLKFAARNSQVLPTVAKATYTGTGTPPEEVDFQKMDKVTGKPVPLTGSELVRAGFEKTVGASLSEAIARQTGAKR